jgi:tripartite-type tricarboxylate transporter receptor subunit TctC
MWSTFPVLSKSLAALSFTIICATSYSASADSVADFYRGKTVRVVVGFAPGGGYDINARLAARYLGKYLPGSPNFLVQNMPGASGMAAARHIYGATPKDGTVMGTVPVNLAREQALYPEKAVLDVRKYIWIGRMVSGAGTHFSWHLSGLKSFADLKTREVVAAGTGAGANSVVFPVVTNKLLGTRIKVVSGYPGSSEAMLALQRGEVDIVLEPWQSIKTGSSQHLRDKEMHLLVQYAATRHPDLPDIPTIIELCETEEQRQLFGLLLSSSEIGRSLVMTPDVPAERAKAMQAAFVGIMNDKTMLEEADKQQMGLDMMSGVELEKIVSNSLSTPPELMARLKDMLDTN